ncbi:MAG: S1 RNA-binding domain-containing protein [Chloroflexi bacterium]|nr:S1 RNA-binding domain-containing protein [Chloroflexota bacterium]
MESSIVTDITSSANLERKMHLKGKVLKTSTAGAIVDIGVEQAALLHVSQIITPDNQPLKRVSDVLAEGQEVDVWVRSVRSDRIEVTMRAPFDLEWRDLEKDKVVKGKVVELEKFGAYVDIGAEKPGLVHISELTHGYVKSAADVVSVGDEVEVKILDFNRRKRQIKLSMRAMEPEMDTIEGVTITPARKPRKSNKKSKGGAENKETTAPVVAEPTAMEIALRAAMEKSESESAPASSKSKKSKGISNEQEDLLKRTLKNR